MPRPTPAGCHDLHLLAVLSASTRCVLLSKSAPKPSGHPIHTCRPPSPHLLVALRASRLHMSSSASSCRISAVETASKGVTTALPPATAERSQ
eukprot:139102-Chlamydomonas_euryale.AAC.5